MKPISLILLTVGRTNYLQECLKSLARQTQKPARLVLVNDGLQLPPTVIELAQSSAPDVTFLETAQPRSGQWRAFRAGLNGLQNHYPFALVHDDDRLKSHYIETLSAFAATRESPWICSHNLEVFSEGYPFGGRILPNDTLPLKFTSREEVCLRYSHSFLPFPGTCFGMAPSVVAALLREEYQEMADVVLLCECAHMATVFYEPDPLYEYRRHPQQVSERMDHSKEDRLQAYLLEKTEGSPLERKVRRNLEKRRADRYFSWAWDKGRFSEYPFRLDFSWKLALRPLRNRKKMALTILIREIGDRLRSWAAIRRQA